MVGVYLTLFRKLVKTDISTAKINKLLHCNKFLDKDNIENILVPA
jgi:hypothetical protein